METRQPTKEPEGYALAAKLITESTERRVPAGAGSSPVTGYAPQQWSAETPKRCGWWWWKWDRSEEPLVLAVTSYKEAGHEWFEAQHPFGWLNVETMDFRFPGGRWAGPLSEPLDAPDAETGHTDQAHIRAGEQHE